MPAIARTLCSASLDLSWSVLGSTAMASGTVAWVRVERAATDVEVPPQVEALRIEETGDVPRLRVHNDLPYRVLVAGNLVVKGGWQTRTIERSVVLAPGADAFIPVRCVEAGRWSGRGRQSAERFDASDGLGLSMRRRATRLKSESLRHAGAYSAPQAAVWDAVADELTTSRVRSKTASYEAFLDGVRTRHKRSAKSADVTPPEGANGVLLLPADGRPWLEVLPTPAALASQLGRILPDLYEAEESTARRGRAADPRSVMARIWKKSLAPLVPVAGTLGDAYGFMSRSIGGELLMVDGALAHLSCGSIG